ALPEVVGERVVALARVEDEAARVVAAARARTPELRVGDAVRLAVLGRELRDLRGQLELEGGGLHRLHRAVGLLAVEGNARALQGREVPLVDPSNGIAVVRGHALLRPRELAQGVGFRLLGREHARADPEVRVRDDAEYRGVVDARPDELTADEEESFRTRGPAVRIGLAPADDGCAAQVRDARRKLLDGPEPARRGDGGC